MHINIFPKCFNSVCATFCIYFTQLSILHKCFVIYNVQLKINLPLLLIWLRKTKIQYTFYKRPFYANAINKWGKFISFLIRSRNIWTFFPLADWLIFFDGKLNFQQISICIFPSILSTMSKWLPFWFPCKLVYSIILLLLLCQLLFKAHRVQHNAACLRSSSDRLRLRSFVVRRTSVVSSDQIRVTERS